MSTLPITQTDRVPLALAMVIGGTFVIACCDLATKAISDDVSLWQLQFMRSAIGILLLTPLLLLLRKMPAVHVKNTKAVALRTGLMGLAYLAYFAALAELPIALVAGGFFSAPIFMVVLSPFILKESVGIWRIGSVCLGFFGVLLILQPGSADFKPITLLPVLCGFLYALCQLATRKYCKEENPLALSYWLTIAFMFMGLAGLLMVLMIPAMQGDGFLTRPITMTTLMVTVIIVGIAIGSLTMHFLLSGAYQNAPASLVAPLEYLYMPIAIIGGYLLFGEVPSILALLGITLIISSGLIIAWRERVHSKENKKITIKE